MEQTMKHKTAQYNEDMKVAYGLYKSLRTRLQKEYQHFVEHEEYDDQFKATMIWAEYWND